MEVKREQWSSRIGFIFAAAGSAIGLGNIWRFPYIVGVNGGAAFVLLYIIFVIAIGLPYMFAEIALGRHVQRNPVSAIKIIKPNSAWILVGLLGVITGVGILSFYGVVAGWTLGYIIKMGTGNITNFGNFIADPFLVIFLYAAFLAITALIVYGGIESGIERWSKILMPVLFILLFVLIIYSNSLEGSVKGLIFYLKPDFSKITGKCALDALGQAFFSLSLGMGLMITYGSYLAKEENIISSAFYIVLFDTLIAIMAGLAIFPALFAVNESPAAGPTLVFVVLPKLFMQMPGGIFIGVIFFILLSIAALTSTISLLEVAVTYIVDEHRFHRKKIVWPVTAFIFLVGIPSALSQGAVDFFSNFAFLPKRLSDPDFLSQMSFIFGTFSLAFGALLLSVFIGWIWGADKANDELNRGCTMFRKIGWLWKFLIQYFIPLTIFILLLNIFGFF
jgi:NSS family neurotransmitter:Na+ symporter